MTPADELRDALQAAIGALESVEEAVVVADAGTLGILAVNRAARDLLDGVDAIGRPLEWLFPDADQRQLRQRVLSLGGAGSRSMGLQERPVWEQRQGRQVAVRLDLVQRDDIPLLVAFVRDTPEERALRPARADALTALAGRSELLASLDAEIRRAFRHRRELAVVTVRLDLPRNLDAEEEEAVLTGAAARLRSATRAEEPVARTGRHTFAWLLPETGAEGARMAAERARDGLADGLAEASCRVTVGLAALARGDTALALLRRAERDALEDPGPGRRAGRSPRGIAEEAEALLRAAGAGDARAVEDLVGEALGRHGHCLTYDQVLQPAMARLGRGGAGGPERSAGEHGAAALIEWAVARRPVVHPPPAGPVIVILPLGVDVRRVTLPATSDAAALAGWMPVVLGLPTAADPAGPISRLSARAIAVAVGDDTDLLEAGHLLDGLAEALPHVPLLAAAAPGGILRRWRPGPPVQPVQSSVILAELLGAFRLDGPSGRPDAERTIGAPAP